MKITRELLEVLVQDLGPSELEEKLHELNSGSFKDPKGRTEIRGAILPPTTFSPAEIPPPVYLPSSLPKVPRMSGSSPRLLQYSEMVDLLSKLSEAGALINYKLEWLGRKSSRLQDPMLDLRALVVQLSISALAEMDQTFVMMLQGYALTWTREPGGSVIMDFGVERTITPGLRVADYANIEKDMREQLAHIATIPSPYVDPEPEERRTKIEINENDPPGVRLGLVAKED
jgi:hypothetical protein